MRLGDFLGMNLITGTKTISVLYRGVANSPLWILNLARRMVGKDKIVPKKRSLLKQALNYEFKLNWGPFEILKRKLIHLQVQRQMKKLRKEDEAVTQHGTDQIPKQHLEDIANDRSFGIKSSKLDKIRQEITYQWLPISTDSTVCNSTLLWFAVLNYGRNEF